jgi:4-amino-4-deoxy-L-arabinose transferase-like glycosyltransferase
LRRLGQQLASRPQLTLTLTLLVLGGLAVFFRVYDLGARNLWTDEAWVALAALQPTPGAALAVGQSTPPFYLLTVWAAAHLLGGGEAVLRSLSLLFGLGTLAFFWLLARALVSKPISLFSLAFVSLSPVMVYYSKELKQYSGDAFFAVLIFFLVERLRAAGGQRGWLALALAGLLGMGFSHPLVFILPVAGLVLMLDLPAGGRLRVLGLGAVWAFSFVAYYLAFFRNQVDPELVAYFAQDFPDLSGPLTFLRWLGEALYRYFWYFLGECGIFWGAPLLAAGAWTLLRQGRGRALLYLGGPLLLAFGAALFHRYPFMAHYGGNRLMLFSAPLLYLAVATGWGEVLTWLWKRRQKLAAVTLCGLLLGALNPMGLVRENLHPLNNREELQPLVAYLESALQPQDWIYVYYFANCPFKYYFRGPRERISWGKSCVESGLTLPSTPPSLWLIASHILSLEDLRQFAAGLLGSEWRETDCLTREGAALLKFEYLGPVMASKTRGSPPKGSVSEPPTRPPDKACK